MQFDTDIKCHCLDDFESKLNYVFKDKIFLTLGEDTVIATLNDASQFTSVKEGRTLHIRNFLMKGGRLILTEQSKIMQGSSLDVPAKIIEKGRRRISPSTPMKTIKELNQRNALETNCYYSRRNCQGLYKIFIIYLLYVCYR